MNVNGNNVTIEIGASAKTASDNIKQLSSALKELKSSVSGSTKGMSTLAKRLSELAQAVNSVSGSGKKLSSMAKVFESIGKIGESKIPKSLSENLKNIVDSVKDVSPQAINNLDKMTSALQRLSGVDLKGFKDVAEQSSAASVQARVAEATSGRKTSVGKDAAKYERELNRIDKSIERTQKKIAAFKKELAIEQSTEGGGDAEKVKNYNAAIEEQEKLLDRLIEQRKRMAEENEKPSKFSVLIDGFKKSLLGLDGVLKSAGRGILSFGKTLITLPFKKTIASVGGFVKKIGQLGAAFKRVMFYRAIRKIIKEIGDALKEGAQNLYYYSQGIGGQFAASMDMAATSMLYFKNSIGAAVAPLVNAFAPVLDMIVDKVVEVINVINQLFAKLTGASSWTKAIKYPKQYDDAVSGAGKSAKEALRYLAPFDELNVLPSDNAGRGSGASAAEDYSSMFEEVVQFNDAISDFAEKIREAINAGNWSDVGKLLGEKVNGIVNSIDFAGIGAKIGEKINDWFTTKYWTFKTINFQNIGSKVAEFLTGDDGIGGALRSIDFETIGRSFAQKFTILPDMIIGFIQQADWKKIGQSIGDYLRGVFDEWKDWLDKYDWSKLGEGLANDLLALIEGINFDELANSFFDLLGTAISSVAKFTVSFTGVVVDAIFGPEGSWSEQTTGEKIKSALGGLAGAYIGFHVGGLKGALIGATIGMSFTNTVIDAVFGPESIWSKQTTQEKIRAVMNTIAGGVIGFTIGGPFGALIGATIGFGITLSANAKSKGVKGQKDTFLQGLADALTVVSGMAIGFFVGGPLGALLGATIAVGFTLLTKADVQKNAKEIANDLGSEVKIHPKFEITDEEGRKLHGRAAQIYKEVSGKNSISATIEPKINESRIKKDLMDTTNLSIKEINEATKNNPMRVNATANLTKTANNIPARDTRIAVTANYTRSANNMKSSDMRVPVTANYTRSANNMKSSDTRISATANFNKADYNLTDTQRRFWSIANFVSAYDGLKPDQRTFSSKALFDEYDDRVIRNREIRMKAALEWDGNSDGIILNPRWNANGGVFANGKWNPITAYAGGGNPMSGELFVAREMGPELVGRMGQHTAVMNNDQIVASVSNGVEVGVTNANENVVNAIFTGVAQIISAMNDNSGSGNFDGLARAVTRWQTNNARANGI